MLTIAAKKFLKTACLVLGLSASASIWAVSATAAPKLVIEKNHSHRIALKASAGSVIVGNPDIADVNIVDSQTVYIVGRGYGTSSISITDKMGRQIYSGDIVVTASSQGSVTLYKGKQSILMLCNQICVPQDASPDNLGSLSQNQNNSLPVVENTTINGFNPMF